MRVRAVTWAIWLFLFFILILYKDSSWSIANIKQELSGETQPGSVLQLFFMRIAPYCLWGAFYKASKWTVYGINQKDIILTLCCLQEIGNVILDWEKTRERIFQIPGVNRTLFLITLEKCFLALRAMDCVDILSQILRMSAVNYLQPDVVGSLPNDLQEDAFRNLWAIYFPIITISTM